MDPKTLNLDPAFLLNLDPDPGFCQFWRKKFKNSYRGKTISLTESFCLTIRKKEIVPEEIFGQLSLHMNGEFLSSILHLLPLICHIFTGVDPDPYSEYGSTSLWIRIQFGSASGSTRLVTTLQVDLSKAIPEWDSSQKGTLASQSWTTWW